MSKPMTTAEAIAIWKRDNLMIAAVEIISDALATTKPLTPQALISALKEETQCEPETLAMVMSMLISVWNGIKFEEDRNEFRTTNSHHKNRF